MLPDSSPRIRRTPLARTAPIRRAASMFQAPEPRPREPSAPARVHGPPPPQEQRAPQGPEEKAVACAYQVLEESMRRGLEAARRYPHVYSGVSPMMPNDFPFPPPAGGPFSFMAASPMTQLWNQMLGTWWGMLGSMAQPFMGNGMPAAYAPGDNTGWGREYQSPVGAPADVRPPPAEQPHSRPPPVGHAAAPQVVVVVVVGGGQPLMPVDVAVDILPEADLANLQMMPLHAIEQETQRAITGRLESRGGASLYLSLHLSADLPPGTYVGALYDRTRREVAGSVSLHLQA